MYSSTVTQFEERKKEPKEDFPPPVTPESHGIFNTQTPLIWRNVIGIIVLHVIAIYALVTRGTEAKLYTWIFSPTYGIASGIGVTAGAHRLWAHKSYSARTPLRILLAILYCGAGETCLSKWIRDHRTHHKYNETSADPHDASRGFFFSHVGWLMMKRHPNVKKYGNKIDMSDIYSDPVIQFFDKYYTPIMLSLCFAIPMSIPYYFWNETVYISIHAVIVRYVWLLNATFCVNSVAHMFGNRPYDKEMKPTENATVSFFALGEGWHNYHHSFPWDYKAAELGGYGLNPSTAFIEFMSLVGLAYNLKSPSIDVVEKTAVKKGDGTKSFWGRDFHRTKYEPKIH